MRLTACFRRSFCLTFPRSTTSTLRTGRGKDAAARWFSSLSLGDFSQSVGWWQRESGLLQTPTFWGWKCAFLDDSGVWQSCLELWGRVYLKCFQTCQDKHISKSIILVNKQSSDWNRHEKNKHVFKAPGAICSLSFLSSFHLHFLFTPLACCGLRS